MRRASFFSLVGLALVACGGQSLDVGSKGTTKADPPTVSAPTIPPSEQPPVTSTDPNDVWLAFDTLSKTEDIYIVRADGSQLQRVDLGMRAEKPAFSPNGKALAFAGSDAIWVRDLTNGTSQRLTSGDAPTWSPDGKHLAFLRDQGIWIIGADGSGERLYIEGPPPGQTFDKSYLHPVFTRDGMSVLFDRSDAVLIGAIDGSGIRDLIRPSPPSKVSVGTISPDGSALLLGLACNTTASDGNLLVVPFAHVDSPCSAGTPLPGTAPMSDSTVAAWGTNGLVAWAPYIGTAISVLPANGSGTPTTVVDTVQSLRGAFTNGHVSWSPPGTVVR